MARFYAFTFPSPAPRRGIAPRRFSNTLRNVLKRVLDAIIASRLRQAERELQRWSTSDPLAREHRAWLAARLAERTDAQEVRPWPR